MVILTAPFSMCPKAFLEPYTGSKQRAVGPAARKKNDTRKLMGFLSA